MPRPGPRLYECVRRAWHSERHQPIRGLIIQQVFRLVHDNHSGATKKNKEWQEKLPVVVFKVEEIMYSKANSEAEYSNFETLWDRINDAIDTIIRKDESEETRELLPPCVEVALNLGCVPVRASRSQRHNIPRPYLRPYKEWNSADERNANLLPAQSTSSSMLQIPQNVDSSELIWGRNLNQHIDSSPFEKLHSIGDEHGFEVDHTAPLNRGLVYPLYYGREVHRLGFQEAERSDSVIVGVPVSSSAAESWCLQNLFPCGENMNVGKSTCEVAKDNKGKGTQVGFDLSLRLGMFSDSNPSREKSSGYENMPVEKEFSLFPMESAQYLPWLHKHEQNEESENQNAGLVSRKHKIDVGNNQIF